MYINKIIYNLNKNRNNKINTINHFIYIYHTGPLL